MAYCRDQVNAFVVVLRPADVDQMWFQTDLVSSAWQIPGVTVVSDHDGRKAQNFGVSTSGHSLLYAADGRLVFSGGITASRGHAGDNDGSDAIMRLVCPEAPRRPLTSTDTNPADQNAQQETTCVYGCPLFGPLKVQIDAEGGQL